MKGCTPQKIAIIAQVFFNLIFVCLYMFEMFKVVMDKSGNCYATDGSLVPLFDHPVYIGPNDDGIVENFPFNES